jgi:hypothetical protein
MRVRWFGEPWPSAEERASICEDDKFMVKTPVGRICVVCEKPIVEGERGVMMGSSPDLDHSFRYDLGSYFDVCVEHIDCLIATTAGPEFAGLIPRVP